MIKKTLKLITVCLVAAFAVAATGNVRAEDKKPETVDAAAKKDRPTPFGGTINEIDQATKTISIGKTKKRTIQITDKTKIMKDGKAATLADAKAGDEVGGSYRDVNGKLEAGSLRIGPKPEGSAKPKSEKKKKK